MLSPRKGRREKPPTVSRRGFFVPGTGMLGPAGDRFPAWTAPTPRCKSMSLGRAAEVGHDTVWRPGSRDLNRDLKG